MPRRKIRDEQDALDCLMAAKTSGLARSEWARAHGIDERSLNGWRVALERRDAKASCSSTAAVRSSRRCGSTERAGPSSPSAWTVAASDGLNGCRATCGRPSTARYDSGGH
ncbi:MAG: transposase-like protein [Myxococcota bacterium]|jgi:transposase-like protein